MSGTGAAVVGTRVVDPTRVGHYRWWICALLFLASSINYIDRQVIGILKPSLQQEFGWSEVDYGTIVMAFQAAYAIGLAVVGRWIDRIGTRVGFGVAMAAWSLAAMAHAGAAVYGAAVASVLSIGGLTVSASVAGFMLARFALGLGEAANFPAGIKAVAEWFPRRERAFAAGLFNAGTNVGAIAAPLLVPWLTIAFGWQWAFLATGAIGFAWLLLWLRSYRSPAQHPRLDAAELAHIQSDPIEPPVRLPWRALLGHRQTWAFAAGKFITDPVWWLYIFWIPDFLNRNYGLDLSTIGPPLVVIFLAADVGSIAGGWLSSHLIARGWSVNAARKTTMLTFGLFVLPVGFAARTTDLWTAVGIIALAAAAHQGWSSNLFTLTSDMFPRGAVASVVGLGGMAGAISGIFIAGVTAAILEWTGSYVPIFAMASVAYLVALACIHLLSPRLAPARL
jgi:ACS family hexuronate transporter-like MFS transporter